ncbi:GNAT family N-acetyltransferase [Microbacterium rhizomatis]|uniref:GNAT family N-acetyltransferase n=1 Tax=Microbacterium rhizomatis TaxID=1631477 RepID=A0A5J5J571_9MICO|nr:GNAT family N-acetyltransferase [Microbacterium rhizomatis]KAA9111180.1 GNAT family N-acetyltransferase [Microbacterium rhizomatis]
MAPLDAQTVPLDPGAGGVLAAAGLRYRTVDIATSDFVPFIKAANRGFLGEEPNDEQIEGSRERLAGRRLTGIFDATSAEPATPIATVDSWVTDLSLPGRRTIPMWAISGVTVSPTHRRKGVARAMLEGELRAAAGAGIALAGLTVTEATIYGRFGFAPAVSAADWVIDTRRARWVGPAAPGRVHAVDRERLRSELASVHDRARLARPGDVPGWTGLWRRIAGLAPGNDDRKVRGVIYVDESGATRGAMAYTIGEEPADFTRHDLAIAMLVTESEDAYRSLWRFALEHDLVSTVRAPLRSVDEPLRWMIEDQRAATVTVSDHGWLRILDVPAVLTARAYSAPLSLALGITDDLGFAHGVWHLDVDDDGHGTAEPIDAVPDLTMTVRELGSVLLGGVRPATLRAAGRMQGSADAVTALDRSFASVDTPYLSIWY